MTLSFPSKQATSWFMVSSLTHFPRKTQMSSSHFCSRHQCSWNNITCRTRKGYGISCRMRPTFRHYHEGFVPRICCCHWTLSSARHKVLWYLKSDGRQTMKSMPADTSRAPCSSSQSILSIGMVRLVSGYWTFFKAAIPIFTTEVEKHHLGEREQLIYASM